MAGAQRRWGTIPVDSQRGRFAGQFDLGEEEVDASGPDDLVVAVVVARVGAATPKINRKGELEQVTVYTVEEMRVPDEDMRDALVRSMGLMTPESFQVELPGIPPRAEMPDADPGTGEIFDHDDGYVPGPPDEHDAPVAAGATVSGSVAVGATNGTGPEPEQTREPLPVHDGAERVGSIYGRDRKDGDLARFLES